MIEILILSFSILFLIMAIGGLFLIFGSLFFEVALPEIKDYIRKHRKMKWKLYVGGRERRLQ